MSHYLKVTFINESTGEYLFYEVTFRAVRAGTIGCIELSTPVRQSISHTILLENPLPNTVTFQVRPTLYVGRVFLFPNYHITHPKLF